MRRSFENRVHVPTQYNSECCADTADVSAVLPVQALGRSRLGSVLGREMART